MAGVGGKELRRSLDVRDRLLEAEGKVGQLAREKREAEKALERAMKDLESLRRARAEDWRKTSERVATLEAHVTSLVRENEELRSRVSETHNIEASFSAKLSKQESERFQLVEELRRQKVDKTKYEERRLAVVQLQDENERLRLELKRLREELKNEAERIAVGATEGIGKELNRCREQREYYEKQTNELRTILAAKSESKKICDAQQAIPQDYETLKQARIQLGHLTEKLQLELKIREGEATANWRGEDLLMCI
eukprot:753306-Hanusia_phi.AAC.3